MNETEIGLLVDALERGERAHKAFKDGLEAAKRVQGLAQVEREITDRVEKAKAAEEAAQYALIEANDALGRARSDAKDAIDKAVAEAQAKRDRAAAEAKATLDAAGAEAKAIATTVVEARAKLADLKRRIDDKTAELTDIESRIAKAREKAAEILRAAPLAEPAAPEA